MRRKIFLLLLTGCLILFVGYRLYVNFQTSKLRKDTEDQQSQIKAGSKPLNFKQVASPERQLIKIKGIVREKGSKYPLSGAAITIYRFTADSELSVNLVTNAEGGFEFETEIGDVICVIVTLKGYTDMELREQVVHRYEQLVLELAKCGSINGTLVCEGVAVPNTLVSLFTPRDLLQQTRSDSRGEFHFKDLIPTGIEIRYLDSSPESYELRIEHPDHCTLLVEDISLGDGQTLNYVLELIRCGTIQGRIYDESFRLVDNTKIYISAQRCEHFKQGSEKEVQVDNGYAYIQRSFTAMEGEFILRLPQGYYHVIVDPSANLIPYKSDCLKVVTGATITHDIYLKTGKTISGMVTDELYNPLSGAHVSINQQGQLIPSKGRVTGADGRFLFEGLAEGLYRIKASPPAFPPLDQDYKDYSNYKDTVVENIPSGTNNLRIVLKKKTFEDKKADVEVKLSTITGTLSESKFVKVRFINEEAKPTGGGGPAKNRVFKKEDYLLEGTYTVLAVDRKLNLYGIIRNQYITKLQNNLISIVLDKKGARIKGRVLNMQTFFLSLDLIIDKERKLEYWEFIYPDDEGNFELSGLPPGPVVISWTNKKLWEFDLSLGETKDLGTIDLKEER